MVSLYMWRYLASFIEEKTKTQKFPRYKLVEKTLMPGKTEGKKSAAEDEMIRQHH